MFSHIARFTFMAPLAIVVLLSSAGCGEKQAATPQPATTRSIEGGVHETEVTQPATESATEAPAAVPAGLAVTFPADRSMGTLRYFDTESQSWVEVGAAQGVVSLPEGKNITLEVSEEASTDLSPLVDVNRELIPTFVMDTLAIAEDQYPIFGQLSGLKKLSIDSGFFTDALLAEIAKIESLQELSLEYTPITDAGIVHLLALKNLKSLNVSTTAITSASVETFKQMQQLTYLDPQRTEIKDDEAEQLRIALPNTTIVLR